WRRCATMRINIKRNKDGRVAVLISFDCHTEKFQSKYERNKFFRGLYGWKQTIRKNEYVYEYRREGLLDEIPHIKVDSSVFIVAMNEMDKILNYMKKWRDKIDYKVFKVLLDEDSYEELKKKGKEIKIE
ncbi:MAG: hypothetical protein J7L45_02985, partial [Candidatus Aenigmarchaeota archaeon]|nr:hypothetical protein [Candidatus Aenigmarchaeota archaeon]